MRVAVVVERTARHEGSVRSVRLTELIEELSDRGHEVAVFCRGWWDGTPPVPTYDLDDVTYKAVTKAPDAPAWRFGLALPNRIRRFSPDVIHAAATPPHGVLGASVAGSLTRTPLVVDWIEHSSETGRLRRRAALTPDRVITPSNLVRTDVLKIGRHPATTDVIPYSVDMDEIRSIEPESRGDIVYSRHLDEDANLESLLLALAELRTVGWSAVVLGDGPERSRYEQQAGELRIDDRVTFLGRESRTRRLQIYKGAHVAIHTAHVAPFAREFLRALACGCVGIAEYHEDSSAHELIEQRERGMGVTSEDNLTAAIEEAAQLPHKSIEEDFATFDESAVLEQYLACYREVQSAYGLL